MRELLRTFFSVKGRATRREWWIVYLAYALALTPLGLLALGPGSALTGAMLSERYLAVLVGMAMWAPMAPVSIRRMRDRQLSSWVLAGAAGWCLLAPLAAFQVGQATVFGSVLSLAGFAVGLFVFVQLALLPSKLSGGPLETN